MPAKPIRPGDNCPDCGSLLFPHCPDKTWPKGCDWVKCRACGSYGNAEAWLVGVPDEPDPPTK